MMPTVFSGRLYSIDGSATMRPLAFGCDRNMAGGLAGRAASPLLRSMESDGLDDVAGVCAILELDVPFWGSISSNGFAMHYIPEKLSAVPLPYRFSKLFRFFF